MAWGKPDCQILRLASVECGHPGVIVTASGNASCNNRGVARCTDVVAGCNIGVVVTCSGDHSTN